jgi:hypothetical protein
MRRKRGKEREKNKKWWDPLFEGEWRPSKNRGWGKFREICKMRAHLEILLELSFSSNLQILE